MEDSQVLGKKFIGLGNLERFWNNAKTYIESQHTNWINDEYTDTIERLTSSINEKVNTSALNNYATKSSVDELSAAINGIGNYDNTEIDAIFA